MFARPLRRFLGRPRAVSHFHFSATSWASRKLVRQFKLADIGEGITECEVIKWSVQPSATVQAFDPLCEVQSDKASVEITSPFDGVIKELLVQEGEVAKVGAGLCLIEVNEEDSNEVTPVMTELTSAVSMPEVPANVKPSAFDHDTSTSTSTHHPHPLDPNFTPGQSKPNDVLAPPSVRHFARQNGVDITLLSPGSGKDGRVEKRDVESYLRKGTEMSSAAPAVEQQGDLIVELGRTRYGMWKAMVKSLEIPLFGYSTTFDLTALHELLPVLKEHIPQQYLPSESSPRPPLLVNPAALCEPPSAKRVAEAEQYTKLTFLPMLVKTLSKAMIEWPLFRSSVVQSPDAKPMLCVRPHADISIALSTPTGLYTPTLQKADTHSIFSLAAQLKRFSHLGRQTPCGLSIADMPKRGGTVTVSNVGAIGAGDFAAPVLVHGNGVAIVAIGRAKWVWDVNRGDGKGERRLQVGISWSADHRVVEGAEMAAFAECWRSYVETPQRLIAEGV